jgi:hypothetical protein
MRPTLDEAYKEWMWPFISQELKKIRCYRWSR